MFIIDNIFINGKNKVILSRLTHGEKKIISICDNMKQAENKKIAYII